jgi:hypothetical protein
LVGWFFAALLLLLLLLETVRVFFFFFFWPTNCTGFERRRRRMTVVLLFNFLLLIFFFLSPFIILSFLPTDRCERTSLRYDCGWIMIVAKKKEESRVVWWPLRSNNIQCLDRSIESNRIEPPSNKRWSCRGFSISGGGHSLVDATPPDGVSPANGTLAATTIVERVEPPTPLSLLFCQCCPNTICTHR